jgi:hypothetical protein
MVLSERPAFGPVSPRFRPEAGAHGIEKTEKFTIAALSRAAFRKRVRRLASFVLNAVRRSLIYLKDISNGLRVSTTSLPNKELS